MNRIAKKSLYFKTCLVLFCAISLALCFFDISQVRAEEKRENLLGKVYLFDSKSKYPISSTETYEMSNTAGTYGNFYIKGNIIQTSEVEGVTSLAVDGGTITVSYDYNDSLLTADEKSFHLTSDDTKEIDGYKIDSKIGKGTLYLQTSKDGSIWYETKVITNAFEDAPSRKEPIYEATDIQLINGTYYRLIVAYELSRTISDGFVLGIGKKQEIKKVAEVYEFYAFDSSAALVNLPAKNNRKTLGEKKKVEKYEEYGKAVDIDKSKDPHFGWDIGEFFVGGYTQVQGDSTFIKETGDRVTLWFTLKQNDINKCNENEGIHVVSNGTVSDTEFKVKDIPFGKGALIILKRNEENKYEEPLVYINFLEASASPNADTKVHLFEEGDYEVTLDYELQYDKTKIPVIGSSLFPEKAKYKISFDFKIRNGNTIIFLKDVETGSELSGGAVTGNGFVVDFANSKYLQVYCQRLTLVNNVFDVRKNSVASDGDSFTDEGVYTLTIENSVTGQKTEKLICVGTQELLDKYYLFKQYGYIPEEESIETPTPESVLVEPKEEIEEPIVETQRNETNINIYITVIPIAIILASIGMLIKKRTYVDGEKQ